MIKYIRISILMSVLLASCQDKTSVTVKEKQAIQEKELAVNLKKISLDIEGMTCEIGCARIIQSKLSKTEGVQSVHVNFEEKEGVVEYDSNKVSKKNIIAVVEKIAGGDTYKVVHISDEQ